MEIKWNPREMDWVALNTDGAVLKTGVVGCGGVFMSNNGD